MGPQGVKLLLADGDLGPQAELASTAQLAAFYPDRLSFVHTARRVRRKPT